MQSCIHCGKDHPPNAVYCPETGLPLRRTVPLPTSSGDTQPLPPDFPPQPTEISPPDEAAARLASAAVLPAWAEAPLAAAEALHAAAGAPVTGQPSRAPWVWIALATVAGLLFFFAAAGALAFWYIRSNAEAEVASAEKEQAPTSNSPPTATYPPLPTSTGARFVQAPVNSTPTVLPSPTPTTTPSPTPTEVRFTTRSNPKDGAGMVFVEAGPFLMGSDAEHDPYFWGAESPRFSVQVDDFWIYQTEVTNAMYRACVRAKACPIPQKDASRSRKKYHTDPLYDDYPVIFVDYTMATAYCGWAGARLPTEAQWEKAARGTDGRLFPWGSAPAEADQANFCDANCVEQLATRGKDDGYADTAPVGSYPAGVSPYGALDMAGNVWEWVRDWFVPGYNVRLNDNPLGPASSRHRGIRGGSWANPAEGMRAVLRDGVRPDLALDALGFRCAVEAGR